MNALTFFNEDEMPFQAVRDLLDKPIAALILVAVTKDGVIYDGGSVPDEVAGEVIAALEKQIERIRNGEARPQPGDFLN